MNGEEVLLKSCRRDEIATRRIPESTSTPLKEKRSDDIRDNLRICKYLKHLLNFVLKLRHNQNNAIAQKATQTVPPDNPLHNFPYTLQPPRISKVPPQTTATMLNLVESHPE